MTGLLLESELFPLSRFKSLRQCLLFLNLTDLFRQRLHRRNLLPVCEDGKCWTRDVFWAENIYCWFVRHCTCIQVTH